MRISIRLLAAIALTFGFAACGGDDDGDGGDNTPTDAPIDTATAIDAAIDAPPAGNSLGQVCDFANPMCPAGHTCTGIQDVGSTTMGYCSPMCTRMGGECAAGYTGPAGGMPVCALSMAGSPDPTLCAIICTMPAQCPTGLSCIPVTGQNVSVCAPPA